MLDMKALLSEFTTHVASMTDDDVYASIENAERLTAECAGEVGDIGEYDLITSNETESQSIQADTVSSGVYTFISSYSTDICHFATTWAWEEENAA